MQDQTFVEAVFGYGPIGWASLGNGGWNGDNRDNGCRHYGVVVFFISMVLIIVDWPKNPELADYCCDW
jgi:hypothetical protein